MVLHPLVEKKKVYTIFYSFNYLKKKKKKKRKGSSILNLTYPWWWGPPWTPWTLLILLHSYQKSEPSSRQFFATLICQQHRREKGYVLLNTADSKDKKLIHHSTCLNSDHFCSSFCPIASIRECNLGINYILASIHFFIIKHLIILITILENNE